MPEPTPTHPDTPTESETALDVHHNPSPAVFTATPGTLPERLDYARALAAANLLPANYRKQPANVLYAMEYAAALGLPPMAAITGVHVIDGKPTASAGLISALVRRAGHRLRVRVEADDRQMPVGVAEIVRADDPGYTYSSRWTLDRAAAAGLLERVDVDERGATRIRARTLNGKPTSWEHYPEAMLKARAITEVARDACEEALFGVHYTPEEVGVVEVGTVADVVDAEPGGQADVPAARQATHSQLTALHASLGARGITDRATKLAWCSDRVRRPLASSADLTAAEASTLLDELARDAAGEQASA